MKRLTLWPLCIAILWLSACTSTDRQTPPNKHVIAYDNEPPEITQWMTSPSILVFSKTKGWRHNEGIAGADRFFADLSTELGYGLFTTENGAVFNDENLARFDVIVFNNMSGDSLSPDQKESFQSWLEGGGAWIGLHSAGDASHTAWPWYDKNIIGPEFIGHPADPQFQDATLRSLDPGHPILKNIPDQWSKNDEWYSFDSVPQDYGLMPLIGLLESSYQPRNDVYGDVSDLRMGASPADHPIVWAGEIGGGRIFYSAIGHSHTSYDHRVNRQLLKNAFLWVTAK